MSNTNESAQNANHPTVVIDGKYLQRFEQCGIQRSAINSATTEIMEATMQAQATQIAQVIGVEQQIWKDIATDNGLPLDRQWRIEPREDGGADLIDLGPIPNGDPVVMG